MSSLRGAIRPCYSLFICLILFCYPRPAASAPEPAAQVEVLRQLPGTSAQVVPAEAGLPVRLEWRAVGSARVVEELHGHTDAQGVAHFVRVTQPSSGQGHELRAVVEMDGVQQISAPIDLSASPWHTRLVLRPVTGDPRHVAVDAHLVVLRLPNGLEENPGMVGTVLVQHLLVLRSQPPWRYDSRVAWDAAAARGVPLAIAAQALQTQAEVLGPQGECTVSESAVHFLGEIGPTEAEQVRVLLTYLLPTQGDTLSVALRAPQAWRRLQIITPQLTELVRAPFLSLRLEGPGFVEDPEATEDPLWASQYALAIGRDGIAPGEEVRFQVSGWPHARNRFRHLALFLAILAVVGGALWAAWPRRRAGGDVAAECPSAATPQDKEIA